MCKCSLYIIYRLQICTCFMFYVKIGRDWNVWNVGRMYGILALNHPVSLQPEWMWLWVRLLADWLAGYISWQHQNRETYIAFSALSIQNIIKMCGISQSPVLASQWHLRSPLGKLYTVGKARVPDVKYGQLIESNNDALQSLEPRSQPAIKLCRHRKEMDSPDTTPPPPPRSPVELNWK